MAGLLSLAGILNPFRIAAAVLFSAFALPIASASAAPSEPCSLLPATQVSKTLGRAYNVPQSSTAPRPYMNTVQGTDCTYSSNRGGKDLLFRIYFDHSPSEATDLHSRRKMFYSPPSPVSGVGDEAYFDPRHGLHVRKGNVRFYLNLGEEGFTQANQQQLIQLASLVAGQL